MSSFMVCILRQILLGLSKNQGEWDGRDLQHAWGRWERFTFQSEDLKGREFLRPKHKFLNNIKIGLWEAGCESVSLIRFSIRCSGRIFQVILDRLSNYWLLKDSAPRNKFIWHLVTKQKVTFQAYCTLELTLTLPFLYFDRHKTRDAPKYLPYCDIRVDCTAQPDNSVSLHKRKKCAVGAIGGTRK